MNLQLPADACVQIFIAPAGYLPLSEGAHVPAAPLPDRPRRRLLKGAALLALLGGAYVLGGHSVQQAAGLQASAQSYGAQPPAGDRQPPRPPEVPQAFAQQLQQPPTVTPPPGAAPSAPPAKNAFGLED